MENLRLLNLAHDKKKLFRHAVVRGNTDLVNITMNNGSLFKFMACSPMHINQRILYNISDT